MLNVLHQKGNTALHFAAMKGHVEIAELLLENGADDTKKTMQGKSCYCYLMENDRCKEMYTSFLRKEKSNKFANMKSFQRHMV